MNDLVKIVIVVALVGLLGNWYLDYRARNRAESSEIQFEEENLEAPLETPLDGTLQEDVNLPDAEEQSPVSQAPANNFVIVADQSAGDHVLLESITLENAAWVAIHEETDGKPGKVLGAQYFDKGEQKDRAVSLLRPTKSGMSYFAMLHNDTNDDRQYGPGPEEKLTDGLGNVIAVKFLAQ